MGDVIMSSKVRLARNFADLPFRDRMSITQSELCSGRVLGVMKNLSEEYHYFPMQSISEELRDRMLEKGLITSELCGNEIPGSVLIRKDEKMSVMINEDDHLRILSFAPGDDLITAYRSASALEDAFASQLVFAFDDQWGYLTACPTNTGTGMRASVLMHLPVLTQQKQLGNAIQLASRLGMSLRGVYGEGNEALGNIYMLSNQITLGRTEHEIIDTLSTVARELNAMENAFREKSYGEDPAAFEDRVFRSVGALLYARRMEQKEFMSRWSDLRLACEHGLTAFPAAACDDLLIHAQPSHISDYAEKHSLTGTPEENLSAYIRTILKPEVI